MTDLEWEIPHIDQSTEPNDRKASGRAWHPVRSPGGSMTTRFRAPFAAGLLILSTTSRATAADPKPVPVPAPPSASSSSTAAPVPHHPRTHFFVGEVTSVIPNEGLSIRETLRDGSPKVTFFKTSPDTPVSRGKEKAAITDIHVNDHVTVKYTDNGTEHRAISIRLTPSAKSKASSPATPSPPKSST